MKNIVILGGTGFIGFHFCRHLIVNDIAENIVLVDMKPLSEMQNRYHGFSEFLNSGRVRYVQMDVRKHLDSSVLPVNCELIANFAAVHREPGHDPFEYFETNILGAENVCKWAESVCCQNIIFTSSIAPYGPSEDEKTEQSIPVPVTAYGASKLTAEKIHETWLNGGSDRKLLIVRPGVVFGPGEGGNVTRLVRSVLKRYFFYMGNQSTRKSGIYVKELCNSMIWGMNFLNNHDQSRLLFNATMNPPPSVKEYVDTICDVAGVKRRIFSVPFGILLWLSYPIDVVAKLCSITQPVSPVRIRKLVRSNNIIAKVLNDNGYEYKFTLNEAMADWKSEFPEDWN